MTVEVPINVKISSGEAVKGGDRVVRKLDDIERKSKAVRGSNSHLDKSFRGVAQGIATIDGPLGGVASRFTTLKGLVSSTGFALAGFTVAAAGAGFAMRNSVREANNFATAMAEVNTLVGNDFAFQKLTNNIREVSKEFGLLPVEQSKASYQIISAGASSAAEATNTLTAANKLAIGGVTSVATAADGLTTVLNAYGDKVANASSVSDTLFVGMRAGKTTIAELSSSLGKVAPLAAQTNTSFDELVSATAALTKGGISTQESMTGLRAILAAVAKPTKEASDLAGQLGINFSAAGLQSKGFSGFLNEVKNAAGGSTEQLAQLFGGVEALVPILALTGVAGEDFNEILGSMANKAGETEKAFTKMAETPQFVFNQLRGRFVDLELTIGNSLLTVIVPATQLLIDNFDDLLILGQALVLMIGTRLVISFTLATAAMAKNTVVAIAHQVAMARLAATIGGVSTANVLFTGTAVTARGALLALASPVGLFAAIGGFLLLRNRVDSAEEAMNSFLATLTVLGAGLLKLVNYTTVPARAMVNAFKGAFGSISDIFDAFKRDIATFFENPLSSLGLVQTRQAIAGAFVNSTVGAVEDAIKDVKTLNGLIDESVDGQLVEWGRQNREAAKETDEFSAIMSQTSDEVAKLKDALAGQGTGATTVTGALGDVGKSANDAGAELSKLGKFNAQELSKSVERAAERIFDVFSEGTNDLLSGNLRSWKDYGSSIFNIIKSTFADIATLALAKPIIIPLIGAAAGALGLDADTTTQLGESFGVSGLGSLASSGSSILSAITGGLNTPIFGSGSAIGGAIDSVGSFLGIGGQTLQGPTLSGAAGYTGGLSTAFTPGAALSGAAGSFASSLLGLSGEYSGITGTAGSIAGTILGSAIGMPWLGAFAGGFLGDAIGGLFGGGRPHPAANVAVNEFGAGGSFLGSDLNFKHLTEADAANFQNTYGQYFQAIGAATGSDLSVLNNIPEGAGFAFAGGIDDGTGFLSFGTGDKDKYYSEVTFDPNDEDAMQQALGEFAKITVTRIDELGGEVSGKLLDLLDNIETEARSAEEVINDIAFISNFEKMFEDVEAPLTNAETALNTINDRFDEMRTTAERLGFTLQDVNRLEELRVETIQNTKDAIFQASVKDYLNQVAPGVLEFGSLYGNYQAQLKEFGSVGIDTTFIDKTFQIQQEKLLQDIISDTYAEEISLLEDRQAAAENLADEYDRLSKSLGDAIFNLRVSDISPLSAEQKLNEARSAFTDTANRAALGDVDAMASLEGLGQTFLDLSRDYYASTDAFTQDFNLVEKSLNAAKDTADRQLTVQQQLVQSSQDQITAIENQTADLLDILATQQKTSSVINSSLQVSSGNANETLVQGIRSGVISEQQLSQILPVFDQLGAPKGDGVGGRSLFFEANPAANAAFIQAARTLGIPGFAYGGDVMANSAFMMNDHPTRPEIYRAGAGGGRVIPIENGAEVEQLLIEIREEGKAQVNILQSAMKRLIDNQERQLNSTQKQTKAVKRK